MPAAWLGPGGPGAGCASLRPRALRPRWSWCGGHRLQARCVESACLAGRWVLLALRSAERISRAEFCGWRHIRRVLGGGGSAAAAPRKHSFKASTFVAKSSKRTTQKLTSDGGRKQPRLQHSQQRTHKVGRKQPQRRAQLYFNFTFFPFPLGPLLYRRTIRYTVRSVPHLHAPCSDFMHSTQSIELPSLEYSPVALHNCQPCFKLLSTAWAGAGAHARAWTAACGGTGAHICIPHPTQQPEDLRVRCLLVAHPEQYSLTDGLRTRCFEHNRVG